MEVLLLRHGKTQGNLERRYIGRTDEPLCASGAAEAAGLRGLPAVSRVFVSPLLRARQTAAILFPEAVQIPLADLREMDFGAFENRSAEEMAQDALYRAWVAGGCTAPCPGGEDVAAFSQRVCAAFLTAVEMALDAGEPRLVLVAHGGTLMSILYRYATERRGYYDYFAPNCGGWTATLDAAWPQSLALRDCARFPDAE